MSGAAFQAFLDSLIAAYRNRLGVPNLPFVLGPSRPDAIATNSWYANINAVQIATPGRVTGTAYIPGAVGVDFYQTTDAVHFNQVGNRAMGAQYAHALQNILTGPPTLTSPTGLGLRQGAGTDNLDVGWVAVTGATGYKVEYRAAGTSTWSGFGTTAALNAHPTGLTAGTSYSFRVTATDGFNNLGPVSTVFTAATVTTPPPAGLYLDKVGVGAFRAAGLRKLNGGYAGAGIRVRRSTDNARKDIGFAGVNLDTTALLGFVGSGSGYIVTWYDQSGRGRNLTQSTSASQARIVAAGVLDTVNGKPAAVFDGTSDYYSDAVAGRYAAGSASVAAVVRAPTPADNVIPDMINEASTTVPSKAWGSYRLMRTWSAKYGFQVTANNGASLIAVSAGSLLDSATHTAYVIDSGSTITSFIDGAAGLNRSYARSSAVTPNNFSVGAMVTTQTRQVINYYTGSLSEFIVWTGALSTAQRQAGAADEKLFYGTP